VFELGHGGQNRLREMDGDDPRINFAISNAAARGRRPSCIQVESDEELTALSGKYGQIAAEDQPNADCCYACWITSDDRSAGIVALFHTDTIPAYGDNRTDTRLLHARRSPSRQLAKPARAARKRDLCETENLECSVSVHRQFGAQHPGRSYPELDREKQIQSLQRGEPSGGQR
jgi:hypothetical protein